MTKKKLKINILNRSNNKKFLKFASKRFWIHKTHFANLILSKLSLLNFPSIHQLLKNKSS